MRSVSLSEKVTKRREKVSEIFKNRKYEKMTSRISADNQLLQLTRVDIAFKKQMLEKMKKSGIHSELANLNQLKSSIGSSIQQSIGILR